MSRRMRLVLLFAIAYLLCLSGLKAGSIVLHTRSAVAWLPQQTIEGTLIGIKAKTITIHKDTNVFTVAADKKNAFSFSLTLHDNNNHIWAHVTDHDTIVSSDTVMLQLGYHPAPVIKPYAVVTNSNTAVLHASVISNPWKKLQYHWTSDPRNPTPVEISNANDSLAHVRIPGTIGTYYFHLTA